MEKKPKTEWPPKELVISGFTYGYVRSRGNRHHYFSNRLGEDTLLSKKEIEQILKQGSF